MTIKFEELAVISVERKSSTGNKIKRLQKGI